MSLGAKLALAIAFFAALYGGGYYRGGQSATQRHEAQARAQEQQAHAAFRVEVDRGNRLAAALEAEKARMKTVYRTIKKEVPVYVDKYIPAPGAAFEPVPACIYTRGFIRLWGDANLARVPEPAGEPADTAFFPSAVGSRELLSNHVENAELWTECRAQLNALIDWHEGRVQ